MSGTFKRARVEELPAWLSDEIGEAHQATVGEMQDVELRKLKDGVLATLLDTAPDDALPHLGATYYLPPFLKETAERHRARLDASWETHERGGRRDGITGILSDMQIVDVDLREDHEWTGAPGEWFSRIWPIVGPDFGPVLQTLPLTTPFETSEADGVYRWGDDDGLDGRARRGAPDAARDPQVEAPRLRPRAPHHGLGRRRGAGARVDAIHDDARRGRIRAHRQVSGTDRHDGAVRPRRFL